jgi:hypothetical protein
VYDCVADNSFRDCRGFKKNAPISQIFRLERYYPFCFLFQSMPLAIPGDIGSAFDLDEVQLARLKRGEVLVSEKHSKWQQKGTVQAEKFVRIPPRP